MSGEGAGAAQYPWAMTAARIEWRETEPLEYHRLFRGTRRYRWWKPLLAVLLAALYYFTLSTVFAAVTVLPYLLVVGGPMTEAEITELLLPDTQRPMTVVLSLASIILMIPAVWLAMLSAGLGRLGRAWSVAARIRWRLLGRTMLIAVVAVVVMNALGIGIELVMAASSGGSFDVLAPAADLDWSAALWSMLAVLILVPLQATAEELVFRGLLMQTIGAWMRSPWLAIGVPAILFGFSHIYDLWGWLSVVAMAVAAGWISWRTGGLEAAISLHVVNNMVAFGFMSFGIGGSTAQTSETGGPLMFASSIVGFVLFIWWADRDFFSRDGVRTRIDVVEIPVVLTGAIGLGGADRGGMQTVPMPVPTPVPVPVPEPGPASGTESGYGSGPGIDDEDPPATEHRQESGAVSAEQDPKE